MKKYKYYDLLNSFISFVIVTTLLHLLFFYIYSTHTKKTFVSRNHKLISDLRKIDDFNIHKVNLIVNSLKSSNKNFHRLIITYKNKDLYSPSPQTIPFFGMISHKIKNKYLLEINFLIIQRLPIIIYLIIILASIFISYLFLRIKRTIL